MDNVRNIIKILFRYTSSMEVINKKSSYNDIKEESFLTLANAYMSHYSNNEIINMRHFFKDEFQWHNNKIRGEELCENKRNENVFDAILMFADSVLVEENGKPLCRYEHLLRWRDMVICMDEDLFISSFLAQKDMLDGTRRQRFFWAPVIGHNNKELNRLMEKGVAENHFHLKGSAPMFHLSWISMMNDVLNPEFKKTFEVYEARRLNTKVIYRSEDMEESLYISYIRAALIRLYLYSCLKNDFFTLMTRHIEKNTLDDRYLSSDIQVSKVGDIEYVDVDVLLNHISVAEYRKLKQTLLRWDVEQLLKDKEQLLFYLPQIQNGIVRMQQEYALGQLDYTLWNSALSNNEDGHLNEIISGERWFLYEMFRAIYKENIFSDNVINMFYAYILIKENIRAELIQVNKNVGFNNFLLYQNRKENFIDGTLFEKPYLRMAVKDTILNQHIRILEARIAPKDSAFEIRKAIKKNDNSILVGLKGDARESLKKRFFYVCHFIKSEDDEFKEKRKYSAECRHYSKRLEVKKQAQAIYQCRRKYPEVAERIRGIDAASEEIVCRPEVFAQAFRFLKKDSVVYRDGTTGKEKQLPDLEVTYHVGEDFLDITDGLRAIDEAICFLNLNCGDRLGHALALGVDCDAWYESKLNRILISQMDYLDNLVWLYAKIRKYRIEDCEDAVKYIEKRYNEYFRIVYLNNMSQSYFKSVTDRALEHYDRRNIKHNYGNEQCYFSINTYYDSWKLRGDNPENFKEGFFELNYGLKDDWSEAGINKIFPENYRIRYNPEAAYLYHTYHYNKAVKEEGNKKVEIKVNFSIKKAVKEVQKNMQYEIAQRGICIETNPTSNALIGTFKRYDKHPILNWYNNGLVTSWEDVQNVPQIQVSINTDDQGVFATYIENEYAYLALAIEKIKDENGQQKYSRTLVYQWLDNIRKLGLSQSFVAVEGEE